jgi:flagellar basal-body rod protein FlgF
MLKGIYRAASGMIPQIKKQEIAANNIANASTPGFKKDQVFLQQLDAATKATLPRKSDWQTPMIDQVYTDYSPGSLDQTGNSFDVAIEGKGFFVTESPTGEMRFYTRNGNFSRDTDGFLVTSEGNRVLGDGGPINVGDGQATINGEGSITVNNEIVGKLQVVEFPEDKVLTKTGESGFVAPQNVAPSPSTKFSVQQGYLERSNINIIKEMVDMIMTLRNFETGSKSIQMQDNSLDALFNQVGKSRM